MLRQGDVYALKKTSRVSDEVLWDTHHSYDPERRLVHEYSAALHGDVAIPASWRGV